MSARISWSIGSTAFSSALLLLLLLSIFGASPLVGSAYAADCLSEPNSAAPENSHWYFRTDRTTQRKCWYLRAASEPRQQDSVKIAQAAPAANAYSYANFKSFIAQRGNAELSDADIERLYAQFLEWRRRTGGGLKARQ